MKKRRIVAGTLVLLLAVALTSCGSMTKKKKYRFGGCQITMVEGGINAAITV